MNKVILAAFILISCLVLTSNGPFAYSQEQVETLYVKGKVTSSDLLKSTVTIQYPDQKGNDQEIMFRVSSHTKITKDDLRLELKDIHEEDEVAVEYFVDPLSFEEPEANQISIKPSSSLPSKGSSY